MAKSKLVRTGVLVIAFLVFGIIGGWAQAIQNSRPTTIKTSTQSPVKKMTAAEELIQYKTQSKNNNERDLQLTLLQSKAKLESGIASKNLSQQETDLLKAQIAGLEARMNNQKANSKQHSGIQTSTSEKTKTLPSERSTISKPKKTNTSTNMDRTILVSKQFTRNQFISLSDQEQRALLLRFNLNEITITDLYNVAPVVRNESTSYVSESNFKRADVRTKQSMINNPDKFMIISDGSVNVKPKISRTQLDALPAAKKQAILNSGRYEITN